jgi:two-component system, chemotaxis family, protein-glutamate methylesterase/glutaminase
MAKIRVLLVEDSLTIRKHLGEVIAADPDLEVVGEAGDGQRAIELCQALRPDAITLDMMLPVMTGLAVTEHIMGHFPTPILIVSSSFNRGDLFKTYDALAAGAVDVLEKPRGDESDREWEQRFCAALKLVSRIKVITHPRARLGDFGRRPQAPSPAHVLRAPSLAPRGCRVVALGASTGGPSALVTLVRALPAGFPIPIVAVLHLDAPFGNSFADWLDAQVSPRVAYPREGETVDSFAGAIAMAPSGSHLTVREGRFRLTAEPPRLSCRPSVDVLFESIASGYGSSATACLLTGMGRDGAAGLLEIRRAGGFTMAQDEATSVVYGMPREAMLLGAADQVLPLEAIGRALAALRTDGRASP